MDLRGIGENYAQSVPGMLALRASIKPLAKRVGLVLVRQGMPMRQAAQVASKYGLLARRGIDWYLQPAESLVKNSAIKVASVGKSFAASGAAIPMAGAAAALATAHAVSRVRRVSISPIDYFYSLGLTTKPTKFQQEMMDKKWNFKDIILGDPISVLAMKLNFKIKERLGLIK